MTATQSQASGALPRMLQFVQRSIDQVGGRVRHARSRGRLETAPKRTHGQSGEQTRSNSLLCRGGTSTRNRVLLSEKSSTADSSRPRSCVAAAKDRAPFPVRRQRPFRRRRPPGPLRSDRGSFAPARANRRMHRARKSCGASSRSTCGTSPPSSPLTSAKWLPPNSRLVRPTR